MMPLDAEQERILLEQYGPIVKKVDDSRGALPVNRARLLAEAVSALPARKAKK